MGRNDKGEVVYMGREGVKTCKIFFKTYTPVLYMRTCCLWCEKDLVNPIIERCTTSSINAPTKKLIQL